MDFTESMSTISISVHPAHIECLGHMTPLGKLIRAGRKAKGNMSQETLGELVGKDQNYISFVETGRIKRPATAVLDDIARALGLPRAELYAAAGWAPDGESVLPAERGKDGVDIDLSDPLLNLWASHAHEFTPEERRLLEDLIRMILRGKHDE